MTSRAALLGRLARGPAADYLALTKPRVVLMVLVTTLVGFYLGTSGGAETARLAATLLGTALAAGGTLALNQVLERDVDGKMARTRRRPLPDGRLQPGAAAAFGAGLVAGGLALLAAAVNPLSSLVTALTAASYLFVYTPLKRRSAVCALLGAIPGALPPVTGWVAARGDLGMQAAVLFGILFLWQLPHTLAIACVYRKDYAQAGLCLPPVVDPEGRATGRHAVLDSLALFAVGLLPTLIGMAGRLYLLGALVLGAAVLACAWSLAASRSVQDARRLALASLIYLPALFALLALDKG
ncbi:MAG: heme o synthase [Candidatus Methylomirabilales bacterium]